MTLDGEIHRQASAAFEKWSDGKASISYSETLAFLEGFKAAEKQYKNNLQIPIAFLLDSAKVLP